MVDAFDASECLMSLAMGDCAAIETPQYGLGSGTHIVMLGYSWGSNLGQGGVPEPWHFAFLEIRLDRAGDRTTIGALYSLLTSSFADGLWDLVGSEIQKGSVLSS